MKMAIRNSSCVIHITKVRNPTIFGYKDFPNHTIDPLLHILYNLSYGDNPYDVRGRQ